MDTLQTNVVDAFYLERTQELRFVTDIFHGTTPIVLVVKNVPNAVEAQAITRGLGVDRIVDAQFVDPGLKGIVHHKLPNLILTGTEESVQRAKKAVDDLLIEREVEQCMPIIPNEEIERIRNSSGYTKLPETDGGSLTE